MHPASRIKPNIREIEGSLTRVITLHERHRDDEQHERSLAAGIPVCLSETLPPDRPPLLFAPAPCTMRRRMRSRGLGRTAVGRMRLDQGPLHSPEDAE
jgi:hypothetical protein